MFAAGRRDKALGKPRRLHPGARDANLGDPVREAWMIAHRTTGSTVNWSAAGAPRRCAAIGIRVVAGGR
jgi:hypothetical protein